MQSTNRAKWSAPPRCLSGELALLALLFCSPVGPGCSAGPGAGASSIRPLRPIPAKVWSRFGTSERGEGVDPGESSSLQALIDRSPDGSVISIPSGEHLGTLVIKGRRQLTIRAEPGTASLVQEDEFADVMVIVDSEDILVEGLGMSHRTSGWCTGDVLVIHNTRHVTVRECDISGSGAVGIQVTHSADITVEHNHVHHCTYQALSLVEVYDARIVNNLFRENLEQDTTEEGVALVWAEGTVEIADNTFANNRSTPVTIIRSPIDLCEEDSGPFAAVAILNNVFFNSQSPEKPESIFHAWEEGFFPESGAAKVVVAGNCFDRTDERPELEDHVTSGGILVEGNRVLPLTLDEEFRVASPPQCRGKGAAAVKRTSGGKRRNRPAVRR